MLPLLAAACARRAEPKGPSLPADAPSVLAVAGVKATCAAGELVVTGRYRLRGGSGELLLLVDAEERGRLSLEQGEDVPFTIQCSGVAAGEHQCELVYFGTRIVATTDGAVEKLTVRQRVSGPMPIKVVCK